MQRRGGLRGRRIDQFAGLVDEVRHSGHLLDGFDLPGMGPPITTSQAAGHRQRVGVGQSSINSIAWTTELFDTTLNKGVRHFRTAGNQAWTGQPTSSGAADCRRSRRSANPIAAPPTLFMTPR